MKPLVAVHRGRGSRLPGLLAGCLALLLAGKAPAGASEASEDGAAPARTHIYAGAALLHAQAEPVQGVLLSVVGGRIAEVRTGVAVSELPAAGRLIDLSCCFLLPGLIDTQTHLASQPGLPPHAERLTAWSDAELALVAMDNARKTLDAGFTSIRDMGHHGDSVFAVRDAIARGRIEGPRMQVAGELLRPTGGELRDWLRPAVEARLAVPAICDGPADCRRAVRASIALGADTIKVATTRDLGSDSASQFNTEELVAIREAAHRLGARVTASAFTTDSINLPLRAGFDAIVHGTFADTSSFVLMKRSGTTYIPTLLAARVVREIAENPDAPVSEAWRAENMAIYHGMVGSFRGALASGVTIAFGTDAGWRPHGGNAEQLEQMVELGMTPRQVLAAATIHAAAAMGWEEQVGSLAPGRFADAVAFTASPLEDISLTRSPLLVIKGGKIVVDNRQN